MMKVFLLSLIFTILLNRSVFASGDNEARQVPYLSEDFFFVIEGRRPKAARLYNRISEDDKNYIGSVLKYPEDVVVSPDGSDIVYYHIGKKVPPFSDIGRKPGIYCCSSGGRPRLIIPVEQMSLIGRSWTVFGMGPPEIDDAILFLSTKEFGSRYTTVSPQDEIVPLVLMESTPLHIAAWDGDASRVRLLIDEGTDLNAGNRWDLTALELAILNGHDDAARTLLAAGADPTAGRSGALAQILDTLNLNLASELLETGFTLPKTINNDDLIRCALNPSHAGADDHDLITDRGPWADWYLNDEKIADMVILLLAYGAEINHEYEYTPLMRATRFSPIPRLIEALLNAGCDPLRPTDGNTAREANAHLLERDQRILERGIPDDYYGVDGEDGLRKRISNREKVDAILSVAEEAVRVRE